MIKTIVNEKNKPNKNLLLLNLNCFKTVKCDTKGKHNHMTCVYYHNKSDKRRRNAETNYDYILCKNYKNCKKEDNCSFAHNKIEILYHPSLYKKKFCKKFILKGKCKFENFCFFAHSEEELNINLIHKLKFNYEFFLFFFKTEFCPLGKVKHDLNMCVYSHNFQDYKRSNLYKIKPIQCMNWNNEQNYQYYDKGCPNGINCKYLHGWKEILFHPNNYKKKICKNNVKNCEKKYTCSFLHKNEKKVIFFSKYLIPSNR